MNENSFKSSSKFNYHKMKYLGTGQLASQSSTAIHNVSTLLVTLLIHIIP